MSQSRPKFDKTIEMSVSQKLISVNNKNLQKVISASKYMDIGNFKLIECKRFSEVYPF